MDPFYYLQFYFFIISPFRPFRVFKHVRSAMRSKRWCGDKAQATTNTVQAQQKEQPPKCPVLRSTFPYKKVANVDLPYVVNTQMLVEALQIVSIVVRDR